MVATELSITERGVIAIPMPINRPNRPITTAAVHISEKSIYVEGDRIPELLSKSSAVIALDNMTPTTAQIIPMIQANKSL